MSWIVLIGRIFYSAIFIIASFGHFSKQTIAYASSKGVFIPEVLVPLSGVLALVGGLCLLLGLRAKLGAWLLVIFLVPVTLFMHDFWNLTDPGTANIERVFFFKNLSMLGAALMFTHLGAGPFSFDKKVTSK